MEKVKIEIHDDAESEFTKQRDLEHRQEVMQRVKECESYLVMIRPPKGPIFVEVGANPNEFQDYINCCKHLISQLERML